MRFSQSRMYAKRAVYRKKKAADKKKPADKKQKPARMVTKQIGGDKNGGTRTVRINRMVGRLAAKKIKLTCHSMLSWCLIIFEGSYK